MPNARDDRIERLAENVVDLEREYRRLLRREAKWRRKQKAAARALRLLRRTLSRTAASLAESRRALDASREQRGGE